MTEEQFAKELQTVKFADNPTILDRMKEVREKVGDVVMNIVDDLTDLLTYHPRSSYFDTAYGSRKRDFEFWHGKGSWERNL